MYGGLMRHVTGWVVVDDDRAPGRTVRLHVTEARSGTTLAEAVSLCDGQFAITVPLDGGGTDLLVEALDATGQVLCQQEAPADRPTVLTLTRSSLAGMSLAGMSLADEEAQPALLTGAAADLTGRVARLEASGQLPTGAIGVLGAALGRLTWLDGLLEPARRAILGDAGAAAVLREALVAWAQDFPVSTAGGGDDPSRENALDSPVSIVSADAVGTLASAVLTVGRTLDEQVDLADGLGAVLSVRFWVEALAVAGESEDVAAMLALMGAPAPLPLGFLALGGLPGGGLPGGGFPGGGFPGGGFPGGGFPGGGFPGGGFPGLPGGFPGGRRKYSGIRVHPTISDVVAQFRSPAMLVPSAQERCLIGAVTEVATLRDALPAYRITGLDPANACPGTRLTITGRNFGTHGSVVFPGTAAPIPNTSAPEWTDGRISVVVPDGAGPGPITLVIVEAAFIRCGQVFTVFRTGGSDVEFEGGTAALKAFLLDGTKDPLRVEPGAVVSISCDVAVQPQAQTRVSVTQDGVTIADFGSLAGGGHRQHDFTAPSPAGPVTYIVHLRVSGPCGVVDHQRTLVVAATPRLSIAYLEVTQGLQDAAHTVTLVAGRSTGVRAYLTSGLGGFSYTGTAGEVANVTGFLRVERAGVAIASIPAAAPVTIGGSFADADRFATRNALVFVVPGGLLNGEVTMRVTAKVAGLPGFGTETPGTSGYRTVKAERGGTLTVVRLRMRLTNPAHPAAEPSVAAWQASSVGTQDRYPLGDAGMLVRVPATGDVLNTDHFLGKDAGWEDALDDLDDYADRFDDFNSIFACNVPAGNFSLNGISHPANDGFLANDRRCFLAQAGLQATFAHEMAHTLGVGHAPCGDPKGIDGRLPATTEPGVVGWRLSDGRLMPPMWSELMSYCTPTGATYQDRWPSVALWNILIGQLN